MSKLLLSLIFIASLVNIARPAEAGVVAFRNNQLLVDGRPQPQIWGAEIQYFRLRGGQERNVPRATVIALWEKALDRAVEAKMNMVSFYIPWDFHEYEEGKFDFDGTADDDGDGRPDFPSRDVKTFIRMIEARGIKHIMARPGPYINAEWGPMGFGAIPLWFHYKYPESHMKTPSGHLSALYSYHSPDLLRHTRIWLETVYRAVLAPHMGPGKSISFVQLDNETNYQWSTLYWHDYGPRAKERYRAYLRARYTTLDNVNFQHQKSWKSWDEVQPPVQAWLNVAEDQDWYRYSDKEIYLFLKDIRKMWESFGVREPNVLFTLAESYNAASEGLLPHYGYRNAPGKTGMMTVNLYPKTYETADHALLNFPFKADHDVKAADTANDHYLGARQEWVMGPEIQGGWWRGTDVTLASRQQTYLTTLGHGMKALLVYYFNEGDNWYPNWVKDQIRPYFERLKNTPRWRNVAESDLPKAFWEELQPIVKDNFMAHWWAEDVWMWGVPPTTLFFDAALGPDAEPRAPFRLLKDIGEKIMAPYGRFLATATEATDPVCIIKDDEAHVPTSLPGINSLIVRSDWEGGLLALMFQSGINPRFVHWGLTQQPDLADCRVIAYQDNGFASEAMIAKLKERAQAGATVVNFLHDSVARGMNATACEALSLPVAGFTGRRCQVGEGRVYHVQTPIYNVLNSDNYSKVSDMPARRQLFDRILSEQRLEPVVHFRGGGDRAVAFARNNPERDALWVTLKTGRRDGGFTDSLVWSEANPGLTYKVTDILAGGVTEISGQALKTQGHRVSLGNDGSTVLFIEAIAR